MVHGSKQPPRLLPPSSLLPTRRGNFLAAYTWLNGEMSAGCLEHIFSPINLDQPCHLWPKSSLAWKTGQVRGVRQHQVVYLLKGELQSITMNLNNP